eukprot:8072999-Pyramimonas_sp.AAC.1
MDAVGGLVGGAHHTGVAGDIPQFGGSVGGGGVHLSRLLQRQRLAPPAHLHLGSIHRREGSIHRREGSIHRREG